MQNLIRSVAFVPLMAYSDMMICFDLLMDPSNLRAIRVEPRAGLLTSLRYPSISILPCFR
jgi:hypothetical protein